VYKVDHNLLGKWRRFIMKIVILASMTLMCLVAVANGQTYRWTDDRGVVSFTDNLNDVPAKYRQKVIKQEDITIRNPQVREELKQQEERAHQEEVSHPPVVITPEYVPPPLLAPQVAPPKPESDELPPGRTKSQKIRDNIERRTGGQE
jgi:hypothetical protein